MSWLNIFGSESTTRNESNSLGVSPGLQNVDESDVFTVAGSENVNIAAHDSGAIELGIETAQGSVNATADIALEMLETYERDRDRDRHFMGEVGGALVEYVQGESEANRLLVGEAAAAAMDAVHANERITDKAFTFVGEGIASAQNVATSAIGQFAQFATGSVQSINKQASENISLLGDAVRSDAAKSLDKTVTVAGVAFTAIAVAMIWNK